MFEDVIILYQNDGLANTQRAFWLAKLLRQRRVTVRLFDTRKFFFVARHFDVGFLKIQMKYIAYKLHRVRWIWQLISRLLQKYQTFHSPLLPSLSERGHMLSRSLHVQKSRVIICQSNADAGIFFHTRSAQKIVFDSPTPFSFELEYSPSPPSLSSLSAVRQLEQRIYQKVDAVAFNWHTYRTFVEQKLQIRLTNYVQADSGCRIASTGAHFRSQPKIVFLGNLDDYWSNPELLLQLLKTSPWPIDLYGTTTQANIKALPEYRGYLPANQHHRLSEYQFGLITISQDQLRRHGFSAKHLLYLSYGLPVLCPRWRTDAVLAPATIQYDPATFVQDLQPFLAPTKWAEKHRAALQLANRLDWERTLAPLADKITNLLQETKHET